MPVIVQLQKSFEHKKIWIVDSAPSLLCVTISSRLNFIWVSNTMSFLEKTNNPIQKMSGQITGHTDRPWNPGYHEGCKIKKKMSRSWENAATDRQTEGQAEGRKNKWAQWLKYNQTDQPEFIGPFEKAKDPTKVMKMKTWISQKWKQRFLHVVIF